MRSWRTLIGVSAFLAITSMAAIANAAVTPDPDPAIVVLPEQRTSRPASAHPGPPSAPSLTQTVKLSIEGGELSLEPFDAAIELQQASDPRFWTGDLPPVRVVDARGALEGWEVRWVADVVEVDGDTVRGARVEIDPGQPVVVDGAAEGLTEGRSGSGGRSGRVLLEATEGAGGGTYEVSGTVAVRVPASVDAQRVVVHLAFAVT